MHSGISPQDGKKLILITGGARSGKSELAERLAAAAGEGGRIIYVATAAVLDEEMRYRVEVHRSRRPASWQTVEEEQEVEKVIAEYGQQSSTVLVDCLTVLASNLLLARGEDWALEKIKTLAVTAKAVPASVILVANEVGLGLVPDNSLGRSYRDLMGRALQVLAREADEVYLVWAGLAVTLKGPGAVGRPMEGM